VASTQLAQRRISDVLVVILAMVSVFLVAATAFANLDRDQQLFIFWIDVVICGLFAVEFLASWSHVDWRPTFLLRNWYDLLGMIPVAQVAFTDSGWMILLWVVVVLARIGRAVDRLVGEKVTQSVTARATAALVDAVKHPITVAVLEEVAAVLQTGHYSRNIAAALQENRHAIKDMVREKLEQDRLTGRLTAVPFSDKLVDSVSETTLRVILSVLADPRTDELIADLLRENILQMRTQVHDRAYGDGRGMTSWTPPGHDSEKRRSHAANSAAATAAVIAERSDVNSPDAAAGDALGDAAESTSAPEPVPTGIAESTRPAESPDPLAPWRRPTA
jgi:voltage-gated potassium channel